MFQPYVLGRKLNDPEKGAIVALRNRGISVREIAQQINCSRNTVIKWIRRFEETGDVKRKVGSGRLKKTTPAQDATIFMQITAKPMTSLQEIKGNLVSFIFFCYIYL
jgi:transposase